MTKRRSDRARTMGQEILDRSVEADDPQPETPLTGRRRPRARHRRRHCRPPDGASRVEGEVRPARSD
jgi:hypothetical protein